MCVMFMLILIDDDFSHLFFPTEQIKTVPIFFLRPLMENPRWPQLLSKNQVSAILSLIMNIETQNQGHLLCLIHENGQNIIF